jgi:hypothetical protein
MSQDFPHVLFVSVDVAPVTDHIPRENIAFEVYNIHHGILEEDESFDFVRMECVSEVVCRRHVSYLPCHSFMTSVLFFV